MYRIKDVSVVMEEEGNAYFIAQHYPEKRQKHFPQRGRRTARIAGWRTAAERAKPWWRRLAG
jgi:hypothetical protein